MTPETRQAALDHAKAEFPKEACGLVVIVKGRERFWPCKNINPNGHDQFSICPEDYAEAEDAGEITAIFHSHVNLPPDPSEADKVSCEATGLRWYIVCIPTEQWAEFEPCGYEAPLVGRTFSFGTLDCWALVRDWYKRERDVDLINLNRQNDFWERGENLLGDNYKKAGFRDLFEEEELETGDVIMMQTGNSKFPNHVALYLGDDIIMHHVENRLSSRDVYGGYFKKHTVKVVRLANGQT